MFHGRVRRIIARLMIGGETRLPRTCLPIPGPYSREKLYFRLTAMAWQPSVIDGT